MIEAVVETTEFDRSEKPTKFVTKFVKKIE